MNIIAITIGRNVGDTPMRAGRWLEFKIAVRSVLEAANATLLQGPVYSLLASDQWGTWTDDATGTVVAEDASTFIALVGEGSIACIRRDLANLCPDYKQDAIGMIVADAATSLVTRADHTLSGEV